MTRALRNVSDSEIKLLSIFHRVVARGGLSAAELDLNIGRSTISRHLKDLEVRLGVTLCQRGSAGFALTNEGKEIYQASIELFEAIHRFKSIANDIQENLKGVLKIGLCDKVMGNPNSHVAQALRNFVRNYPDIRIDIHTQQLNYVESSVISGDYQLGIVPIHRETSSLEYEPLFKENMSLYCGRGHRLFGNKQEIPSDSIKRMKFAAMDVNSPNQQIFERLELPRTAIAHEQEGIALLIQTGEYLGFLPDHYAKTFVQDGIMQRINNDYFRYNCNFSVVYSKSHRPGRIASEFIEHLLNSHQIKVSSLKDVSCL